MKIFTLLFVAMLLSAAFINLSSSTIKAQRKTIIAVPSENLRLEAFAGVIDLANREGRAHVIVGLNTEYQPEGNLSKMQAIRQRGEIKRVQNKFLDNFRTNSVTNIKEFEYIPFLAFEADAETLRQMQNDALISSIQEDQIADAALAESTQIVGAPAAWNSGFSGSGQTVAILDSGVDRNHTFLSGKVISEACYSSNTSTSVSVCPNSATESTAVNSGLNCPTTVEGCAHGTNVAGIAAGKGTAFSGVARDANIIAIQMFSRFDTTASCGGTAPCARYWTSDLIKGLERVQTLSATMNNIVAVNLSLQTGQQFTSNCNTQHAATKAAIDNLRSINIATIVCSGNYSFTNALSAPACISSAVSVGATDDGSLSTTRDQVSNFSDSSPLLHLLAPGRWINSSIPNNLFQNYSGTSMAAPHVAGAFAVLRQRRPSASVTQILNALISTGQPITDSRNGIVKPRIRVDAALVAISNRPPFDFDGDGKSDVSVFRPSTSAWYINQSASGFTGIQFGQASDKIVPADFDGDGKTDVAVYRAGVWYLQRSQLGFTGIQFGEITDIPVPADFDGDGKADLAVFRPASGTWYLQQSTNGFVGVQFGQYGDQPMAADFDADGKADLAVYRNGAWYVQRSAQGFYGIQFGEANDKSVPADYDGDGRADIAVYRPANGTWYVQQSTNGFTGIQFGAATDLAVPADYDGDGKTDVAVFRNGTWYLNQTTSGFIGIQFGTTNDQPIPNSFVR